MTIEELCKKYGAVITIGKRQLYWAAAWCRWVVYERLAQLYRGDSLEEALNVLKGEVK